MYFNLKVNFFFSFFLSPFGVSRNFISNMSVSWLKPLTEGIFPKAAINAHSRANSEVKMVIPRCHGGSVRRAVHLNTPQHPWGAGFDSQAIVLDLLIADVKK